MCGLFTVVPLCEAFLIEVRNGGKLESFASRSVLTTLESQYSSNGVVGEQPSRRQRIFRGLQTAKTNTKKTLAIIGAAVALWRGPQIQTAHAAESTVVETATSVESTTELLPEEAVEPESSDPTEASKPPILKGAILATTGTGTALAFHTVKRKKRASAVEKAIPEILGVEELQEMEEAKLNNIERLDDIQEKLESRNEEAYTTVLPLQDPQFVEARKQPKSPEVEAALAAKYAAIESLEDRAFQILVDLGMVETNMVLNARTIQEKFDGFQ